MSSYALYTPQGRIGIFQSKKGSVRSITQDLLNRYPNLKPEGLMIAKRIWLNGKWTDDVPIPADPN